jgi:hypothetical protein
MNVTEGQAKLFNDTLVAAAKKVCPRYNVSVEDCVRAAAEATTFGKFAIHNNYFDLAGAGDRGYNTHVVVERTTDIQNGGCKPHFLRRARFSSPEACVEAYCKLLNK